MERFRYIDPWDLEPKLLTRFKSGTSETFFFEVTPCLTTIMHHPTKSHSNLRQEKGHIPYRVCIPYQQFLITTRNSNSRVALLCSFFTKEPFRPDVKLYTAWLPDTDRGGVTCIGGMDTGVNPKNIIASLTNFISDYYQAGSGPLHGYTLPKALPSVEKWAELAQTNPEEMFKLDWLHEVNANNNYYLSELKAHLANVVKQQEVAATI